LSRKKVQGARWIGICRGSIELDKKEFFKERKKKKNIKMNANKKATQP